LTTLIAQLVIDTPIIYLPSVVINILNLITLLSFFMALLHKTALVLTKI